MQYQGWLMYDIQTFAHIGPPMGQPMGQMGQMGLSFYPLALALLLEAAVKSLGA